MASVEEANSQVRRIAILVTSLDATAGRQLLMAMPSELAREVRRAMTRLTHVDPEEQRQILAAFRSQAIASPLTNAQATAHTSTAHTSHSNSNSLAGEPSIPSNARSHTTSTEDSRASYSNDGSYNTSAPQSNSSQYESSSTNLSSHSSSPQRPWQRLDVATLTKLLRGERATVIAVVLSQLDPRQAVALLEQLPKSQHREVITSLATLGQIDPDAMVAIDDYLASRIADYQRRDSAETETVGRLQQLLSAAPATLRTDWQEIIRDSDAQLAHRMGIQTRPEAAIAAAATAFAPTAFTQSAESIAAQSPTFHSAQAAQTNGQSVSGAARGTKTSSGGANLVHLLANNVVTTADTQTPIGIQTAEDDEPRVLPFPGVATQASIASSATHSRTAQSGTAQSGTAQSTAARPAIAASKTSDSDKANYPEVVLTPRESYVSSPGSSSSSKRNLARDSRATLARFEHLLDLPAEMIGQTLAECETEIVLLALAGASPTFMQRFISMLERQDARALKARIRELGPIHLQDVDEAQRRVCEVAIRIVEAAAREQSLNSPPATARAA